MVGKSLMPTQTASEKGKCRFILKRRPKYQLINWSNRAGSQFISDLLTFSVLNDFLSFLPCLDPRPVPGVFNFLWLLNFQPPFSRLEDK